MFVRSGVSLSLIRRGLNEDERNHLNTLIRLGGKEELALWSMEHMIRKDRNKADTLAKISAEMVSN